MKRLVLFLVGVPLVLAGCQNEDSEIALLEQTQTRTSEFVGVEHDIAVNILASHFGGYRTGQESTRAMGQFSLTPYVVEGDTLMYVAQYDDGWELYSASHAANMVLFSSDEGRFDMNDPSMPEQLRFLISENALAVGELLKQNTDYVDPSWGGIALTEEELSEGSITVLSDGGNRMKIREGDLPPGHWVLLEVEETGSETFTSPKLIKTKWGQNAPWNEYAKWVKDPSDGVWKPCVAGCSPVALSQYMYFTHFKDGVPEKSVPDAIYGMDANGNRSDFHFLGASSAVWSRMAKSSNAVTGFKESALLIGWTGRQLNSKYGLNSTSTDMARDGIQYLGKIYGSQFIRKLFTFSLIKESISEKGYPLLASVYSNKESNGDPVSGGGGHTMIIDQYKETTKRYRYLYGWVRDPLPPGTVDKWVADLKDANGNIIKYAYTNEVTESSVYSQNISMNWGYSGQYDSIFYSSYGDWNAGGHNFNLEHYVYTKINQD